MIAFSTLGARGRLGNQMFQYAALRSIARRLGVRFYCPRWIGDTVFSLADDFERSWIAEPLPHAYREPLRCTGFNPSVLGVRDGTEIEGYFQSERYFEKSDVLAWYRFTSAAVNEVSGRYRHINFSESVGLHVRMADFLSESRDRYYVARRSYYERALSLTPRRNNIVLFSDDVPAARRHLGSLIDKAHVIGDHQAHEVLFLQSRCRDFVCSPSSFSWWGAWLNQHDDKVIVAPEEGPFRPGSPISNQDFWPPEWLKVPALIPFVDRRLVVQVLWFTERLLKYGARCLGSA